MSSESARAGAGTAREAGPPGRARGLGAVPRGWLDGGMDRLTGRRFAAVIFDLDGTLIDSHPAIARAWTTWLAEFEVTPDPAANVNGMTSEAIVRLIVPAHRVVEATARMEELEVFETEGIRALPGAREALQALPSDRVAVATSGTRAVATARLDAAGLTPPAVLLTADDVEHGKPAPDLFLAAARALGVDPADCLVVEDAPAGVRAARAAGARVLGVLTTTPADDLPADLVVPDLSHVAFSTDAGSLRVRHLG